MVEKPDSTGKAKTKASADKSGAEKDLRDTFEQTAAPANENRNLKFVKTGPDGLVKKSKNLEDYIGWQKINDTTVMERALYEVAPGVYVLNADIYDFGKHTLQTERMVMGAQRPPEMIGSVFFRHVQGNASVENAHFALTKLGGTPGDLNAALGLDKNGMAIEPAALTHQVARNEIPKASTIGFRTEWMNKQQGM